MTDISVFVRQDVGGILESSEALAGGVHIRVQHTTVSEEEDHFCPGPDAPCRRHSSDRRSGACPIRHPPDSWKWLHLIQQVDRSQQFTHTLSQPFSLTSVSVAFATKSSEMPRNAFVKLVCLFTCNPEQIFIKYIEELH